MTSSLGDDIPLLQDGRCQDEAQGNVLDRKTKIGTLKLKIPTFDLQGVQRNVSTEVLWKLYGALQSSMEVP